MSKTSSFQSPLPGSVPTRFAAAKASAPNNAKEDIAELEKKIGKIIKQLEVRKK